jgi:hypothetical protein
MTFSKYFKASSYCLIGSGFAAMIATRAVGWISIFPFAAIFIGSWFADTARIRERIPNWILNCLALAYLPVFVLDYRLVSRSFMAAILHLFLFTAAVKLLTLSKDRDFLLLYLISFAELLAASTLTVNIVFILCFVLFLFSGIGTLILFEMRRSNARMQVEVRPQPLVISKELQGTGLELFSPFPAGLVSATVIGISLFVIACAVPLFLLLPRVTFGLYRPPSRSTQIISGFSERVELGQIGNIKQSDVVVMRIKMDKPPSELPPGLKWRGIAFDHYDGRAWKRSQKARHAIPIQGWYYKVEDSAQGTDWIQQTFFVEALSTNVVFAMRKVLAVSRDVGMLQKDSAESLYTTSYRMKKLHYSAISDPIRPDPSRIFDRPPIPPAIRKTYLQTPPIDPRIAELAKGVTQEIPGGYAKARALEQYLRSHYAYSLALRGTPNSKDPLAMFLFDVREGHCEYFASAMTIMLRQIGIPARLVNGFHIGEYNSIGNNWTVRQYNAHSWVEAYFPPYGWIEFDPTPTEPQHSRSAFVRWISHLADAVDLWWWESVINYDSLKQYRMLTSLRAKADSFRQNAINLLERAKEGIQRLLALSRYSDLASSIGGKWVLWMPGVIMGILLMSKSIRRRILGRTKRVLYRNNPRAVAASFYREAVDLLAARGLKRSPQQTPMEFALGLGRHPASPSFVELTRLYNAARFGPPDVSFHLSPAEALLRSLRESLRTKKEK